MLQHILFLKLFWNKPIRSKLRFLSQIIFIGDLSLLEIRTVQPMRFKESMRQ